ncbi:MAG: hypothetical protein ACR2JY_17585 [Chloroflexota bacterium]
MYYRLIPVLAVVLVVCCLVMAIASSVGNRRIGYGGFYPPIFVGPSWSHGGYYHGSYGGGGGSIAPSSGSSGRSPSHGFSGGGTTGGHGGK